MLVFVAETDFDVDLHRRLGFGGVEDGIPGRRNCMGKGQSIIS